MNIYVLIMLILRLGLGIPIPPESIEIAKFSMSKTFSTFILRLPSLLYNNLEGVTSDTKVKKCTEKLSLSLNNFISDPTFLTLLSHSSKGINDLGDYENCKNSNNSYYLTLGILLKSVFVAREALCLPRECGLDIMLLTKPYIVQFLSKELNISLTSDNVVLWDVAEFNQNLNKIKPGSVIWLSVSLILFITVVVGSILDYHGYLADQSVFYKKFMGCFSFQKNCNAIFNTTNRVDEKLEVLHGIRVLAIAWVVLGHSYNVSFHFPLYNFEVLYHNIMNNFSLAIIKAGTTAVDVFFFLSGFLAALQLYRAFNNPKNRTIKNILLCYFHRYVRLFPWMLFVIIITIYIQPLLYDSPNTYDLHKFVEDCEGQWHWTLLYINNFTTKFGDLCCAWTWYLFIDMQLFLLMSFVMIIYHNISSKQIYCQYS